MREKSFTPEKFVDKLLHKLRSDKVIKYVKPGMVICDLGCGFEGSFLRKTKEIIREGFGFDLFVNQKLNSDKIKLSAIDLNNKIPLPDSSVDLIVTMAVLEHLNDCEAFIKETYRILKNGGILVLSTPTNLVDPVLKVLGFLRLISNEEVHDHKRYFDLQQLTKLLEESGFVKVNVKHFQFGFNQIAIGNKE